MKKTILYFLITVIVHCNLYAQLEFSTNKINIKRLGNNSFSKEIKISIPSGSVDGGDLKKMQLSMSGKNTSSYRDYFSIEYGGNIVDISKPFDVQINNGTSVIIFNVKVFPDTDDNFNAEEKFTFKINSVDDLLINSKKDTLLLVLLDKIELNQLQKDFSFAKEKNYLVTYKTYASIMNKKFSYFLTGSSEVSNIGEYLSANFSQPSLDFALAQPNFLVSSKRLQIKNFINVRLKASLSDDISTLISEGKIQPSTGISLNYSQILDKPTTLTFKSESVKKMEALRTQYLEINESRIKKLKQHFKAINANIGRMKPNLAMQSLMCNDDSNPENCELYYKNKLRVTEMEDSLKRESEIINDAIKEISDKFYPLEESKAEFKANLSWVSFGIDYRRESYQFFNQSKVLNEQKFNTVDYDGLGARVSYSILNSRGKYPSFINFTYKLSKSNSVKEKANGKLSSSDIATFSTISKDTVRQIVLKSRKDFYSGEYDSFFNNKFSVQYIKYLEGEKIAFQGELIYDRPNFGNFTNTFSSVLGFIINAKGKGETKSKFVFSILANIDDLGNDRKANDSNILKRTALELRGSLPFDSIF